jgi:hypothetical protein
MAEAVAPISARARPRRAMHESFVEYQNFRWLKISLVLVVLCALAYVGLSPAAGRSGSTWVGYGLGTLAAGLMVWLTWFGVRKRAYRSGSVPLAGWLSAHVYLGTALLFIVPLHAAFRVGWNVHTLAFALMALTIGSGLVGVVMYSWVPREMTRNRPGEKLSALVARVDEMDSACRDLVAGLGASATAAAVTTCVDRTTLGGGTLGQLLGHDARRLTIAALHHVREDLEQAPNDSGLRQLVETLSRKQLLLERIDRDVQLKALLDTWLVFHVPLALASLAALVAHIVAVFYYR